jgi:glutamate/tyrosine decarboxylase-like PLP-dependent enzyme
MKALIDEDTMLLVGSAPCYPHGVFDRIGDIGKLAETQGIWLHIDACVGGWIAPFFQRIGRPIPDFDFRVRGVRSISADLHKFGFCPKPASIVFYRDRADMERARFVADAWPSGVFQTSTLVGTRPAGSVAGAWTVLNHLGIAGYEKAARRLAETVDAYVVDISGLEELTFWAKPDLSIINFGSESVDINSVAQEMGGFGWLPALTRRPEGMHVMLSLFHAPAREAFIGDLRRSIEAVKRTGKAQTRMEARY